MELEILMIIMAAMATAGLSWTFISRAYDEKISSYSSVITNVGKENRDLRQQVAEAQQSIANLMNNPRIRELEKQARDMTNERQQLISTVNKVRAKIEMNYAQHSLGQYILAELEQIVPSPKTIDMRRQNEAKEVFRRARSGIKSLN